MNDTFTPKEPPRSQSDHATPGSGGGGRLLRRTFIIALVLVSGGLITSSVVELIFRYRESVEGIETLQREMAQGAAFKIQQFVQDIRKTMRASTQTQEIVASGLTDTYRFELIKLLKIAPAITEATALNSSGREQIKMSRIQTVLAEELGDRSEDEAFVRARSGATYFGPVYFVRESEPYMRVAVPIERFAGDVIGVLIAEVNLKYIWDVVSRITVGRSGYVYVVSREGDLIAHPDISLVLQKRNLRELSQVKAALAGTPVVSAPQLNLAGNKVFPAYALIPELGWAVLVERPASEAYELLYASVLRTSILLLFGLGLAVVASLIIGRRVVRPIGVLREGAARIGAGALEHRINVQTGDELEALAGEFNRMASQVQESYANLEQKVEERTKELSESLEQQTATSQILGVIASSPTDVQPVLDAVTQSAERLCDSNDATIALADGDVFEFVTRSGLPTSPVRTVPITRDRVAGRAFLDRKTIHIPDYEAVASDYPRTRTSDIVVRTILVTPLFRKGVPIGVIQARRSEVRPFSDKQIALLKTFADQAVIAIENVRLFKELEARNREISESLEQQTATSEILRVIASSPTDIQPVLDTVAESAARLCDSNDAQIYRVEGDTMRKMAIYGIVSPVLAVGEIRALSPGNVNSRAILDRQTIHIHDMAEEHETDFPESFARSRQDGSRTLLAVPLLLEGKAIGVIFIRRFEVRPFTDKQIALLKTFADQAVIAIENVRLFKELEARNREISESLEQQTATSEVLRVIASSPTDVQPVLDTVAENAAQVCGADDAVIRLVERDGHRLAAHHGHIGALHQLRPIDRGSVVGRAILDRQVIHVEDLLSVVAQEFPEVEADSKRAGVRTVLVAPLLRESQPIGAIFIRRTVVNPFTEKQISLLKSFADQAVIAIENVRLFQEIQEKSVQLEAANKHKSQFLANVSHELRTPLNAIIGFTRVVLRKTEGQIPGLQKENLQKVLISSEHLLGLINGLLDLAKIEAGKLEVIAEPFRLEEIIQVATSTVEPMLKDGRVRLVKDIAPDLPPLNSDRDKLKQIILNLLSNAAKFTEQGEIKVSAWHENGSIKLTVSDTGIGMKQEALAQIFEEFRQVDMSTTRKYGGTGLGLAIVKRLVNLLGGEIGVESEEGKGTKFTMTLPINLRSH